MNFIHNFLSNDSLFGRIMWRCGILIGANLLFIVLSIPIVTIGAANAAMHYTMLKMLRSSNGQISLFSTFFKGFKENFKQATITWLLMLALAAVLLLELFWCSQFEAPVRWFGYGLLALLFIELILALYIFPTMVAFRAKIRELVVDSIYFAIAKPLNLILILLVTLAPVVLTYMFYEFLPLAAFLWCMFGFATIAWCTDSLLVKQFKPYLPIVDAEGDIIPEEELHDPNIISAGAANSMDEETTLKEIRKNAL